MLFDQLDWAILGQLIAFAHYAFVTLYFLALGMLALFGLHRLLIIYLYLRHKGRPPRPAAAFTVLPRITVQLPLFNEQYVAERLIEAVCRLEYPRDLLEIQILDDSTDRTVPLVAAKVARLREEGFQIEHLRREERTGFKAGALQHALRLARGELLAIFDADFLPGPEFLRRTVDYFSAPEVGMVQTSWGHLNREHSLLTRVQAALLDGHFVLEHTARNRSGRLFNFNGTSGVWRKQAIIDAGGWQWDTLTEDLDLSYRAQLRGWKFVYLLDVVTRAELPVELAAFKHQQRRWAKGSLETARKLLPSIWRSHLPLKCKLEACFHLGANLCYLLMAALSVLAVPALVGRIHLGLRGLVWLDGPLFCAATLPVACFYLLAAREAGLRPLRQLPLLFPLMAVGMSLGMSSSGGVLEALAGRRTPFCRTAKFNLRGRDPSWQAKEYRSPALQGVWSDSLLVALFAAGLAFALAMGVYASLPFLCLFQFAFTYSLSVSLWQRYGWRSGQTPV